MALGGKCMSNLELFGQPQPDTPAAQPSTFTPRDYQLKAADAALKELEDVRATMLILATGTGKTEIACDLIRRIGGRTCFIAHRESLISQAGARIEKRLGIKPCIEMASRYANLTLNTPVVASIQSLSRQRRIARYEPNDFALIIIDEVHHGASATYRAVLDYFKGAKVVGLTATPDRADGLALGQVIDSVAFQYEINDAIKDGWLAPIKMQMIAINKIDFMGVRTTAGDLNQKDLDAIMSREEAIHGVVKPTLELSGDRKTMVFTTSIDNSRRMAEVFNRYRDGCATSIDSKMSMDERNANTAAFERGDFQYLVNVGIATEGYDCPPVSCVAVARPTKSRSLYTQMVGRGTRGGPKCPIPGKSDLLVLDFVGATVRHDIVTAIDALAGDESDDDARLIKEVVRDAGQAMGMDEAKEKAQELKRIQLEREARDRSRRHGVRSDVSYRSFDPDPYSDLGIKRDFLHQKYGYAEATGAQMEMLRKSFGKYADNLPGDLGKKEASRLIGKIVDRRKAGLCTMPQLYALQKRGIMAQNFTFQQASRVLSALAGNRWRPLNDAQLSAALEG